jgi:hypothetical protein
MRHDPEKLKNFFQDSVETFDSICDIVVFHMKRKPPSNLKTIIGRWMTILEQVTMVLRRLTTDDAYYTVGEIFGVAAYTNVKNFKRYLCI